MESSKCPTCQASLKETWHRLTPGLIRTLYKVVVEVGRTKRNVVKKSDLELGHSEYGNFQKLRFHGLIAKYKPGGEWQRGTWVLTRRAGDLLRGAAVPARVRTFRNRVVGHDERMVTVKDVMGTEPYFEGFADFEYQIYKVEQDD